MQTFKRCLRKSCEGPNAVGQACCVDCVGVSMFSSRVLRGLPFHRQWWQRSIKEPVAINDTEEVAEALVRRGLVMQQAAAMIGNHIAQHR